LTQGHTEQQQLTFISQLCGSITPESWPDVEKYELYKKLELPKGQRRRVKERLKAYVKDQYALDLIDKLLTLDPRRRIDSDDALNHDFFWTEPMPCDLTNMLSKHKTSMFEFLAPPRKPSHSGHASGHHRQRQHAGAAARHQQPTDPAYDRIF